MTVIQPNSVSGINSITVQNGNSLSVHKSDGSLIRTITGTTGITTFRTISVGSATTDFAQGSGINIGLGASISNGSGNTLTFGTGGDDRATIDSSGRLLVGTTTEGHADADNLTVSSSARTGITIRSANDNTGNIYFSDATSSSGEYAGYVQYNHSTNALLLGSNATDKLWVTAGGVGIQTDSLGTNHNLEIFGNASAYAVLNVKSQSLSHGAALELGAQDDDDYGSITQFASGAGEGGRMAFVAGTTQTMNLRDGRLLVGHTASEAMFYTGRIQVQGTSSSTSAITVKTNQNDSGGPAVVLGKSRGAIGSATVVQSGDELGSIHFTGADGTDTNSYAASISCNVDATPGSNDMPGRLLFKTTADGAASPTERLRIDSSGRVKIGGAAVSQNRDLVVGSNGEANLAIETHNDATSESSNIRFYKSGNTGASPQIVEAQDNIARLQAYGYDGTDYNCQACGIDFAVDGTPGSNDMPGRIVFKTTADGASSPTERLRIDKAGLISMPLNGVLSIGNQAGRNIDWVHPLQVEGTTADTSSISITRNSNDINPPYLTFCKSRGTSIDGETAVQENDLVGNIQFKAADGNSGESTAASITCEIDAAVGNSDTAGRLFFKTSADGSGSPVSRMEINKDGYVYIKTGDLDVQSGTVSDSKGNVRKVYKNEQANAYTLVAADAGKCIGAQNTVTIPASVFGNGDMVSIVNYTGGNITLTQGSGLTLYNTGDGSTGNRTLATRGMATVWFPAGTTSYISGSGLS